jgi:DNA-binding NtrC family response regulator
LYFRINVFPMQIPALRKRAEDIPPIVQYFIRQNNEKTGKKILGLTPEAMEKLIAYPWPGNVRELRNAVEYAFVLCNSGGITVAHLPPKVAGTRTDPCQAPVAPPEDARDRAEREELQRVLAETGGNRTEAARRLGVSRVTVWKRMKKHGVRMPPSG